MACLKFYLRLAHQFISKYNNYQKKKKTRTQEIKPNVFLSPVPDSLCSSDWPEKRCSSLHKEEGPPGNEQETLVAKCGQRSFPSEMVLEAECPLPCKLLGSPLLLIPNKHNNTSSSAKNLEYLLFSLYLKYFPPIGAFFKVGSAQGAGS